MNLICQCLIFFSYVCVGLVKYIESVNCPLVTPFNNGNKPCEHGWASYEDKCYKVIYPISPGVPPEHKKLCKSFGSLAVRINSQAENDWVTNFTLHELQSTGNFAYRPWIITGASKTVRRGWTWEFSITSLLSQFNYTNWGPNGADDGDSIFIYLLDTRRAAHPLHPKGWSLGGHLGKWKAFPNTFLSLLPVLCEKIEQTSIVCNELSPDCTIEKSALIDLLENCPCS